MCKSNFTCKMWGQGQKPMVEPPCRQVGHLIFEICLILINKFRKKINLVGHNLDFAHLILVKNYTLPTALYMRVLALQIDV